MKQLHSIKLNNGKEIESIFNLNLVDSLKKYYGVHLDRPSYTEKQFEDVNQRYINSMTKILQIYDKTLSELVRSLEQPSLKKPKNEASRSAIKERLGILRVSPNSSKYGSHQRDIISPARRVG